MALPEDKGQRLGAELATIDGVTYVHVPDAVALTKQAAELAPVEAKLTPELLEAIKDASPHVRLIRDRVVAKIRAHYSLDDELKMLRLASSGKTPGPEVQAYRAHVEACVAWGQREKAALGL